MAYVLDPMIGEMVYVADAPTGPANTVNLNSGPAAAMGLAQSVMGSYNANTGGTSTYSNSLLDTAAKETPKLGVLDTGKIGFTGTGTKETPWYQNSSMLGSIAGLGSAFAQLAALPSQISMANTQRKALEQNMATAREEQDRRNRNISAFNSFNVG